MMACPKPDTWRMPASYADKHAGRQGTDENLSSNLFYQMLGAFIVKSVAAF